MVVREVAVEVAESAEVPAGAGVGVVAKAQVARAEAGVGLHLKLDHGMFRGALQDHVVALPCQHEVGVVPRLTAALVDSVLVVGVSLRIEWRLRQGEQDVSS